MQVALSGLNLLLEVYCYTIPAGETFTRGSKNIGKDHQSYENLLAFGFRIFKTSWRILFS